VAVRLILILLFAANPLNAVNLKGIDLENTKAHTKIRLIRHANGEEKLSLIKEEKVPYYTPKTSTLILTHPPKIIQSKKFGTLFLYDLASEGKYLNALRYDTMELEGNLSKVSIGLSDRYYARREDHFQLPLQQQFALKSLFGKLDLCRLKYLVIRSRSHTIPPVTRIIFKTDQKHEKHTHTLGVWAWDPKHITDAKLAKQPIKQIYLQMKKGFKQALEQLAGQQVTVYGLNGSPKDIFNYKHLMQDIETLAKLKQEFPFIKGYQLDVEPYLLDHFKENREQYLDQYLIMLQQVKKYAKHYQLTFSVVIPFWFDHLYIHDRNLAFLIVDLADEVTLMSYRSDLNHLITLSQTLLRYANFAEKKISIGIELMKINDEEHTIYEVLPKKAACLTPGIILSKCLVLYKVQHYVLHGQEISFYGQTGKLEHLLCYPVREKSFAGFVLHHFDLLDTLPSLSCPGL